MERSGIDSSRARELLGVFEQTQELFEQYRERLVRKAHTQKQ
jgi:hypothetical protein